MTDATRRPRVWFSVLEFAIASALGMVALIVLRPATLATPYWWDAAAVYAPGARWLAEHQFTVAPGVFPPDLSRGHTPLYYLALAVAFRLGGANPVSGHVLQLLLSAATLVLVYALGRAIFDRVAGTIAAIALAVTPLYLTISSDAYPEIALTGLTAATMLALVRGRYLACALGGTALVLVKETGLACVLAVLGGAAWEALRTRTVRASIPRLALLTAPGVVLAAYFLWQKHATGWFILPYHVGLFEEQHIDREQIERILLPIVVLHGRIVLTVATVLVAAARVAGREEVFPAAERNPRTPSRESVLVALGLLFLAHAVFFAKMFLLERYLLPAHVPVLIAFGGVLTPRKRMVPASIAASTLVAVVVWSIATRRSGSDYASGETTFRYLDAVAAHQRVLQAIEARGGNPVILTSWPARDQFRDPTLGWVSRPFRAVGLVHDDRVPTTSPTPTDAVAFASMGSYRSLRHAARRLGFHPIMRSQVGGAVVEWWSR